MSIHKKLMRRNFTMAGSDRFAVTNKIDTDTVLEICKRVNDQWTGGYDNNSWLHKEPLDLRYRHVACFLKEFLPRCI